VEAFFWQRSAAQKLHTFTVIGKKRKCTETKQTIAGNDDFRLGRLMDASVGRMGQDTKFDCRYSENVSCDLKHDYRVAAHLAGLPPDSFL
jgi:hypothetical protein